MTPVILFALYILPAIVAFWRRHHNAAAIAALNLLLGWTAIGWIVAFIWSLTQVQPPLLRAAPSPNMKDITPPQDQTTQNRKVV